MISDNESVDAEENLNYRMRKGSHTPKIKDGQKPLLTSFKRSLSIKNKNFTFSSQVDVDGKASWFRILVIVVTSLITALVPILWVIGQITNISIPYYIWICYIFIFNTILLIAIGKYTTSSFAYPFTNSFLRKSHMRATNARYGAEFQSTVERITSMIKDMSELKKDRSKSK